jgi:formate hydrogenlyase transcriptional activator
VIVCDTDDFSIDESWLPGATIPTEAAGYALSQKLSNEEKLMIESALAESRGQVSGQSGAAVKLGLPASTLESKIRSLRIDKYVFKTS